MYILGETIPKYIVLETGDSARTKFLMKNGEYEETEDAVLVGKVEAKDAETAIAKAMKLDYCRGRSFDDLVAYEVVS